MEMIAMSAHMMDSREIAERTGKEHAHVCRDIRNTLAALGEDESKFGSVYKGGNGEERRCYLLPKRECLILASGYSVTIRAKIIDRWAELETAAFSIPKTFAEALQLAADQARTIETQALQIEAAKPAVAFMDEYVEAKSTRDISTVGKTLGFGPKAFFAKLAEMGVMFRRGGCWVPYQVHLDAGRFEVKTGTKHGHTWHQSRFTPKGVAWIAMQISGSP